MICALLLAWTLVATPSEPPPALVGVVRVTGPAQSRGIALRVGEADVQLLGDLAQELAHVQSAKVEVVGPREGDKITVQAYRLLDVGGAAAPMVGHLVQVGEGLGLRD